MPPVSMLGDWRRLRRLAAALVLVLPRCTALPPCATGRRLPRPGLHHGGPLGRRHPPGPAELPLPALHEVRGGTGVAAEAAAAQEQQRAGSATRSHERSEFDGILISFAEPGSAPAPRTRRAADAWWCWALTAGATAVALLRIFGKEGGAHVERVLQPWVLAFARTFRSVLVKTAAKSGAAAGFRLPVRVPFAAAGN